MGAYSKHAWVVFGLSLLASTASASIPDANGIIHGCYNQLTGSTRIIDGNNCLLLEKSVNWSQTGPRGPAGTSVTGASLPVGDSHCPAGGVALTLSNSTSYICNANTVQDIYMGWDTFTVSGPIPANSEKEGFASSRPFTESVPGGVCVYNYSARFVNPVNDIRYEPTLKTHGGDGRVGMTFGTAYFPEDGSPRSQASTTAGWYLEQNTDYQPGAKVYTVGQAIPAGSYVDFTVTWTCSGGPNKTVN